MTPASQSPRHWVIGDVHGCSTALRDLVDLLPARDRLVLCGDVINRGPRILEAMELAWDLVASGRAVWLSGNHEADLVASLRWGPGQGPSGLAGCDTYRQLGQHLCRSWLPRLASLPLVHWGDGWAATHAGFDPFSWQPHLRIRLPFWQAYDGRFGTVIVGHTPVPAVQRLDSIVMVDTGACYGGMLSAYCPETGEVCQVKGLTPLGGVVHPRLRSLAASAPTG
jgi:serine/threonine protein phosphatase 1